MKQLASSLTIVDLRAKAADLEYSAGTYSEDDATTGHTAFFPNPDWSQGSQGGMAGFSAPRANPVQPRSEVILFDVGMDFWRRSRDLLRTDLFFPDETVQNDRVEVLSSIRDNLVEPLREVNLEIRSSGPADLVLHKPSQKSTAFNYDTKTFMGLHLDNHQKYPLDERWKSYLLCGVNLGSSHRYFQFVNLTTLDILEACSLSPSDQGLTTNSIKEKFFLNHSGYPVLKVRLEPGQAYVCNTQDVIHDGATSESGEPDISFLFSFEPRREE